jgi:hypothetical protein
MTHEWCSATKQKREGPISAFSLSTTHSGCVNLLKIILFSELSGSNRVSFGAPKAARGQVDGYSSPGVPDGFR